MAGNTIPLYEHFEPKERLTLLLEAMARGDEAEADRLSGSCPRSTYTMRDAAFGERLDVAFDIMAIACIDLRCLWGKLDLLQWSIALGRQMATHHQIVSTMAFLEGFFLGKGKPQMEFFSGNAADSDETAEVDDDASDDRDEASTRLSEVTHGELGRRMGAVEDRAQLASDAGIVQLLHAADEIAGQLAEVWTAFDRFCHDRLGVSARTLLDAWEFPTGGEVAEMLGHHTCVTPDPAKVAEYWGIYCRAWDRRFAGE